MKDSKLKYLDQIKNNLGHIYYETIYKAIANIEEKSFPTALIKKGSYIDRVRINSTEKIFSNIEEVSYIHDINVLKRCVGFGRANKPCQAIFYGSIMSPQIHIPRVTAYLETSQHLKDFEKHQNYKEIFTLSHWEVLEDIEVVEMIFSDDAINENDYVKRSLENQIENYKHLNNADEIEKQCRFFSNEFARNDISKGEEYKYKISAAYFNYICNTIGLKGITYPSVSTDYKGQNVALHPEIVDASLSLKTLGMFKFEKRNGIFLPLDSFKIATDLGENKMSFQWFDNSGADN